ncbi:replication initiation regulator SeqA [Bisgaardia hudsonensis]|uniref:replication initiation regulator SeqA n=1 Tax=Bisgaardia hudsonensis TaxID=109472 RepID=UPI003AB9317C
MGESASDILRRLLDFSSLNHKRIPEYSDKYSFDTQDKLAFDRTSEKNELEIKNRVEVQEVIDESTESIGNSLVQPSIKKQSVEVINQLVDKVRQLLASDSFLQETKAVVRFLDILRILYRTNPESFAVATESLQGRTRLYFSRDEGSLLVSGSHTKPKQIPDTPYWVITNTNSARKMLMLENAMQSMQLPQELIEEVRPFFTTN